MQRISDLRIDNDIFPAYKIQHNVVNRIPTVMSIFIAYYLLHASERPKM